MTSDPDTRPVLLWLRANLRLTDNPALSWAIESGRPVIPVFVLDDAGSGRIGAASRWWLHGSLQALGNALEHKGSRLILRRGPTLRTLTALVRETHACAITWNRLYDNHGVTEGRKLRAWCKRTGVESRDFNASLLFEPLDIRTAGGLPYRVFTPFWRRCQERGFARQPSAAPDRVPAGPWPESERLEDWKLRPRNPDWSAGFCRVWHPGEEGARRRLERFLQRDLRNYHTERDHPGKPATSRLSPHLHFGEIGPRQIAALLNSTDPGPGPDAYLRELGWREFSHHLLFHSPDMESSDLRPEFERMPWRQDSAGLERWQQGLTGYPLVDAGMRELWTTGWMHNRVRMVTASFLTKHLLIDWRLGADWFLDTLVDADRASNSAGWQWVAGCGSDAAPYFRIFNPVAQSRRFDPAGQYLRTWLPELQQLPDRFIHVPWQAPQRMLNDAGVRLGENYPHPMVDHACARKRALETYRTHIRSSADGPPA